MTTARTRHGHSTRRHRSRHTKITRTLTISHFGSLHTLRRSGSQRGALERSERVADLLALLRLVVPVRREARRHVAVRDGARPLHGSALPAEHVDCRLGGQADELGRFGGVLAEVLPGDAALRELAEQSLRGGWQRVCQRLSDGFAQRAARWWGIKWSARRLCVLAARRADTARARTSSRGGDARDAWLGGD